MAEPSINDKLQQLWTNIKAFLYLQLFYVLRWVAQPGKASKHKFHQKLAVVGDEFALGYGDKIRLGPLPGLPYYFMREIARDKKVKQFWSIYNCGVFGSCTRDWLPSSETTSIPNHPHLLENWLTENDRLEGCKIIGLFLGYNDHKASPPISKETTLQNIRIITKHLSDLGYITYIFTVPSPIPLIANGRAAPLPDLDRDTDHTERSRFIRDLVESGEIKDLRLAVEIDASNYEYRRRNLYGPDSLYFSDLGYTKIMRDWFQVIVPALVKKEFATFCDELGVQK